MMEERITSRKNPLLQQVRKLLSSGKIRLTGCKSKRTGKTYDTTLILETEADGKAKFRMDFGKGGGK